MNLTRLAKASRLAAAGLLALAACACSSSPRDSAAALDERRAEAVSLAAQGRKAQGQGKLRDAIELYVKSLENFDEIPGVRTNLGIALIDSGDILKGSDFLKEEVQLYPASASAALTNLGILYKDRRQFGTALDYFFRSLELVPNDPVALRGAVDAAMALDYDESKTLDLILRGLMVERDPKVIEDYKWRQIRVEARLKAKPKSREEYTRPQRHGRSRVKPPEATPTDPASPGSPAIPGTSPGTSPSNTPGATPPAETPPSNPR